MKGRLSIIWGLACLVGLALPGAAWSAGAPGHAKPEMPPALTMPGQTSAPGETTAPGETSEPGETSSVPEEAGAAGKTSAPGKTRAPGRTSAPGQTNAPGRTTAAGRPGAPEAPGFAGKPGHATPGAGRAPLAPALVPLMQHIQALEWDQPWALKRLLTPPPTTSPELTPLLGGDLGLGPAAGLGRLAAQVGSFAHVPTASVQTSVLIPWAWSNGPRHPEKEAGDEDKSLAALASGGSRTRHQTSARVRSSRRGGHGQGRGYQASSGG